jgi:hypothetical protein
MGDWWTPPTDLVSDADGRVRWRGTLGDYRVEVGGREAIVRLDRPSAAEGEVRL